MNIRRFSTWTALSIPRGCYCPKWKKCCCKKSCLFVTAITETKYKDSSEKTKRIIFWNRPDYSMFWGTAAGLQYVLRDCWNSCCMNMQLESVEGFIVSVWWMIEMWHPFLACCCWCMDKKKPHCDTGMDWWCSLSRELSSAFVICQLTDGDKLRSCDK